MAKRRGQPVHGWVNLDKPRGISSAKAVAIVRRVFDAAKAGHGGTLDPLASGVLPIALGEATKTVSYTMGKSKTYEFSLAWGAEPAPMTPKVRSPANRTPARQMRRLIMRCNSFKG